MMAKLISVVLTAMAIMMVTMTEMHLLAVGSDDCGVFTVRRPSIDTGCDGNHTEESIQHMETIVIVRDILHTGAMMHIVLMKAEVAC